MQEITGKIVLQGNGKGLPDITVLAYDVDDQAAKLFDTGDLEGEPESVLGGLGLRRLGSVLSGRRGESRLTYQQGDESVAGPNLGVVQVAPAADGNFVLAGGAFVASSTYRGGRILQSSCGVLAKAAASEALLFTIPGASLAPARPDDHKALAELQKQWRAPQPAAENPDMPPCCFDENFRALPCTRQA
jgi:hypothetical protein